MEIETIIRQYFEDQFSISAKGILLGGDTRMLDVNVIDSMGMLQLVLFVEEEFEIEILEEEVVPDNFSTINQLVAFIRSKRQDEQGQ